jgi:hypothetical protein
MDIRKIIDNFHKHHQLFLFITYTELVKRRAKWIFFRNQFNPNSKYFVLWPSWFVANIWPWKNGLESRSEYLVFVVEVLSVGNVPFRVLLFYRVRIVLIILYNHFNVLLFISYHQKCKPGDHPQIIPFW